MKKKKKLISNQTLIVMWFLNTRANKFDFTNINLIFFHLLMLEIQNDCIVFRKSKNIHQCLYIRGICVRYK